MSRVDKRVKMEMVSCYQRSKKKHCPLKGREGNI